jgi:hypothetical protein
MWTKIATWAVKIGVWAAGHPDIIKQILDDILKAKADITQ